MHFSKLCDKNKDCVYGDDELSCFSHYSLLCPLQCISFAQGIVCNHLSNIKYQRIWKFIKYFKCYVCTLKFNDINFSSSLNITVLNIKENDFKHICISKETNNPTFSSLRKIDMSFNKLTIVKSSCLKSVESLKMLYLHVNKIKSVEDNAFSNLKKLKILDLSYNKIVKLQKEIFIGLNAVALINLTINLITDINIDTFSSIPHYTIHSLNKQVCCMSGSWSKCKVKSEKLSNCNDLLSSKGLGQMFYITSVVITLMNSISIVIHCRLFSQLPMNKFFTLCLSLVDCLYGMYLLIISSVNLYYKEYYAGVEYAWKQGFACKGFAFTTLVFFTGSPIITFVMLMARFCVIQWPMTSNFKSKIFIRKIILAILFSIISCCFSVVISFVYGFESHIPTGLYLLLYTSRQQPEFIWFTSLLIIFVQMISLFLSVTLTFLIILVLKKIKHSAASHNLKIRRNKVIISHLLLAIFTCLCCWIPTTIVLILPLVGHQISNNLLEWTVITVVPINAIVNPIFFSILTPRMKQWFFNKWNSLENHQISFSQILLKSN